ncbi:MAG: glycosyltransferase family 4 protein [Cyanobacteria bacterium P01_C01_bin.70]
MSGQRAKVGFVFLSVFSVEGGIQSYVKDILKAYATCPDAPAADIYLLRDRPSDPNPFAQEGKFTFYYSGDYATNLGRLHLSWQLLQNLWQKKYARLVCGHMLLSPLLQPLCRWLNTPLTMMTYGKEVWEPVAPRQLKALQQAKSVWTISRYSRDLACSANGLAPQKFYMLPCVVNGNVFTPGAPPSELIAQYGLQDSRVLMTVARLWSGDIYKGVDVTIRALPKILSQFPEVKYLVVGRGDDQPRLAKMAADLGVAEHVVFAGFVPDEQLVDHYRLADAYIMPSKEGFGIVYLEAMACGVPTLSGDDDGSADPLQDGRVGWRVPYRDPEAVAIACIEILQGGDQRCNAEWLRQQTLEAFSPESLQQSLEKALAAR